MYHTYSDQTNYVKAHTSKLINEAAQARQAQEASDTRGETRNSKRSGLSSLWAGRASTLTPTVYLSVRN